MAKNREQKVPAPAQPELVIQSTEQALESIPETKPSEPAMQIPKVSANATQIPWPTDVWGLTREFRDAVVKMASRIAGHPDKKALADATVLLALGHIESKYIDTKAALDARLGR